ncbi:MAG TPA: hypothetical protein VEL07_05395 [Planctomycetota bacterium]|nr:hypothetical protein [Planctomycetota bacterium]
MADAMANAMGDERAPTPVADAGGAGGATDAVPGGPVAAESPVASAVTRTHTSFTWQHAPEPWHQLLFLLAAIAAGWWAWRRYGPTAKGAPGTIARLCRVAALVLVIGMLAGPAWRTTATTVLPARVAVAIDRSASMARADAPGERPRIDLAQDLARELAAVVEPRGLALSFHGVGGVPGELASAALIAAPPMASGATSALGDEVAALVGEERPDLLVIHSDGRVTDGSPLTVLAEQLRARGLQVSILAAGGEAIEPGLWIDEIDFNPEAALGESETFTVRASGRALPQGETVMRLLVDGAEVVRATTTIASPADQPAALGIGETRLETTFAKQGPVRLRIEVEHGTLKDARDLTVTVAERKLQVLLLEGRPRYESRYLREALKRDHTITLHAYLGDGRWRQWGDGPADHVPLGANELKDYDVVVIGDLAPEQLPDPTANLETLERAVEEHGIGLIWLPGESGAIARFARTKLGAELIPVELPDETTMGAGYRTGAPRRLERTPTAENQRLLESGGTAWADLPQVLGGAPLLVERVTPGAEVLMVDQDGAPVVVALQHGAGRTMLIGVDDTWRWRRNVGDRYLHRFHSQLLRYVAGGRRQDPDSWRLNAAPRRAVPGELVTLSLIPARALADRGGDRAVVRLAVPDGRELRVELLREENGFAAQVPAPMVGTWAVELIDGPNPPGTEPGELVVMPPTGEVRDPRADRAALVELARATGSGDIYSDAKALVADLPDKRQVREDVLPARGLWDNAWTLAALVTLLAIDWAIRRWNRLP